MKGKTNIYRRLLEKNDITYYDIYIYLNKKFLEILIP